MPNLFIGNFARGFDLNIGKVTGNIKLRWFWKMSRLWDFKIQTDRHLVDNMHDITGIEKKKVWFIDVAIQDSNVALLGNARIEKKQV